MISFNIGRLVSMTVKMRLPTLSDPVARLVLEHFLLSFYEDKFIRIDEAGLAILVDQKYIEEMHERNKDTIKNFKRIRGSPRS